MNGACWGNFDEGNLDVPPDLPAAQKVVVARNTSCALLDDGSVQCWGVPISLPPVAGPYQDIALDYITSRSTNTFCALDLDGRVDCRFYSVTADALLSAAQDSVPTDPGYTDIAVISGYACGVAADGSVDCWGDDRLFITNIPELVVDRVPTVTTATTGLRSEVYSTSTAELFWDGPRTAFQVAGHEIIRNGEVSAFTQNLSSYIVDDLIPGTSTEFSVRRVGINGEIGEPTATITIDSADNSNIDDADGGDGYRAPSRPAETTGLLAEVYSPTALELSWDRAEIGSGVSGYEIRRNGELIAFTRGTSFYNEVATTDRVYRYDVIAIGFNDSQILGFSSIDVAVGSADVGMCR